MVTVKRHALPVFQVEPASAKRVDGQSGTSWSIPNLFSKAMTGIAKDGSACTSYDMVVHPDICQLSKVDARIQVRHVYQQS